jgi:hypothetical protein
MIPPHTIQHSNELVHAGSGGGSNRHAPKLLLRSPDGKMQVFSSASIPGVCRVLHEDYKKNGKWSHSVWTLQLAPGVQAWTNAGGTLRELSGADDTSLRYLEAKTWADVPPSLRPIVRLIRAKTTERLDANEQPV